MFLRFGSLIYCQGFLCIKQIMLKLIESFLHVIIFVRQPSRPVIGTERIIHVFHSGELSYSWCSVPCKYKITVWTKENRSVSLALLIWVPIFKLDSKLLFYSVWNHFGGCWYGSHSVRIFPHLSTFILGVRWITNHELRIEVFENFLPCVYNWEWLCHYNYYKIWDQILLLEMSDNLKVRCQLNHVNLRDNFLLTIRKLKNFNNKKLWSNKNSFGF